MTGSGSTSAVQRSAYSAGCPVSRWSASLRIGPCTVSRTVNVTSSPPATLIVSVRVANGFEPSAVR